MESLPTSTASRNEPISAAAVSPASGLSRTHVESSYRRYAPIYDFLFGATLGPGRKAMTQLVAALAPDHILEVGVGTGLTLAEYPRTARVDGIDVSQEMLAIAHRRVHLEDQARIHLHAMDAELMDFDDNSFDCITLPYVLSVTPDPDRLIREVRRVCRPGGHILIVNHFSGQVSWRFLERLARPLSRWLGFRSEFSMDLHVLKHDWQVLSVAPTNLFALSRLIHIRNV